MKRHVVMGMLFSVLALILAGCLSTDGSTKQSSGVTQQVPEVAIKVPEVAIKAPEVTNQDSDNTFSEGDVNFASEPGTLKIQNNASKDVVIFAGNIKKNAMMGGVRAGKPRTFDLSKLGVPDTGCILIRAATFETYKSKARLTEADVIYTGLVVYNLKDKSEKLQITIYENVDVNQKTCIYVSNESKYFILELRLGNPAQGEVIATLPPLQTNKRIYLVPNIEDGLGYDLYPTYIYVDPRTGERSSMSAGKEDRKRAIPKPAGSKLIPLRFGGPEKPIKGYDVAFINLKNDTSSAVTFYNAEEMLKNQNGWRLTESGQIEVFEIASMDGEEGQMYTALEFEFDNYTRKRVNPYKFKPGFKYTITVTQMNGNYQYDIKETGQKSLVENNEIKIVMES